MPTRISLKENFLFFETENKPICKFIFLSIHGKIDGAAESGVKTAVPTRYAITHWLNKFRSAGNGL